MSGLVSSTPIIQLSSFPDRSGAVAAQVSDDSFEDVCSICLECFSSEDPPTVTHCNHDYHLQCILEWSQRSKDCPICWRFLALKDSASQELLAAVEKERSLRLMIKVHPIHEEPRFVQDALYMDDNDFEECIMRNFEAAAGRVQNVNRRRKQRPSGGGPSQVFPSDPNTEMPIVEQVYTSLEEFHNSGYASSHNDSLSTSPTSISIVHPPVPVIPSSSNVLYMNAGERDGAVNPGILSSRSPDGSPGNSISSDLLTFPESVKSKFSAASSRYKESISKSTRGLKEKLLARNTAVKELSKGVQREMSAGIAGVTRMIERLDLASKRIAPFYNGARDNSSLFKGKSVQEDVVAPKLPGENEENAHCMSSDESPIALLISNSTSKRFVKYVHH